MSSTAVGPRVLPDAVELSLPDPGGQHRSVSLVQEVVRPRLGPSFRRVEDGWRLPFRRPEADRLEYLLAIDGALRPDPANDHVASGPFGDKSVIEWPEYVPPGWLRSEGDEGSVEELALPVRRLVARARVLVYTTPVAPAADAPLVVAHDGPEYAAYSGLTRFLDAMSREERIPPLRAALIAPIDRNETYSASALYAAALVRELLPQIAKRFPHGPRVGLGASLGALALLHAHRRHPQAFDALLLQSGSFFRQRFDKHEAGFPRYGRINRFVGTVLRRGGEARPIPVAITCGTAEENLANNRAVAEALERDGYPVRLGEQRDAHNWTCWRDTFDPYLPRLLAAVT